MALDHSRTGSGGNMKVLSLFDGISCGILALQRAGISVERYVAYEIDKYAIQISEKKFSSDRTLR